jgi:hypothetical protein
MSDIREEAVRAFYLGAPEGDNPYDRQTQPEEQAEWHDAWWEEWRKYRRHHKDWFGDAGGEQ